MRGAAGIGGTIQRLSHSRGAARKQPASTKSRLVLSETWQKREYNSRSEPSKAASSPKTLRTGGEKVNRKLLVTVLALVVVLLATPFIGLAQAGKGQGREDFLFVLVGTYGGPGTPRETGVVTHIPDLPFVATGWLNPFNLPLVVKIGGVPIDPALLSYSGSLMIIGNDKSGEEVIKVTETITIKGMGTLELQVHGNIHPGQGAGMGDNFVGFGTGDLAGVKLTGNTVSLEPIGEYTVPGTDPPLVIPIFKLTRVGTVMGWPD